MSENGSLLVSRLSALCLALRFDRKTGRYPARTTGCALILTVLAFALVSTAEARQAPRALVEIATDSNQTVEDRLVALRQLRSSTIPEALHESIANLAQDPDPPIVVSALETYPYLARSPNDRLDREVLIPALEHAMASEEPSIREAAYAALSNISVHRPGYLRAGEFLGLLESGAGDPEPRVRAIALASRLRASSSTKEREAVIELGLADSDPYVRRTTISWLGSPDLHIDRREELIARGQQDSDPSVRSIATASLQQWTGRKRAWPVELWRLWREGERRKVGVRLLFGATVGTPILICLVFALYCVVRVIVLALQKRIRAVVGVLILGVWAAATYGMVILYFLAGHVGDVDSKEMLTVAGVLWGAIAIYGLLGWCLHLVIRR